MSDKDKILTTLNYIGGAAGGGLLHAGVAYEHPGVLILGAVTTLFCLGVLIRRVWLKHEEDE